MKRWKTLGMYLCAVLCLGHERKKKKNVHILRDIIILKKKPQEKQKQLQRSSKQFERRCSAIVLPCEASCREIVVVVYFHVRFDDAW